eukprot:TRINITY_DN15965_c0_g1_i8.p1 TRINITY_DN15965_c0_g1~~TRINITY_DN15965_c0_g1_i8.p1  ORF type:complete len:315 (+),score=57.31 TRINITY_DN15965_c0_g1_i8:1162-2106(+)
MCQYEGVEPGALAPAETSLLGFNASDAQPTVEKVADVTPVESAASTGKCGCSDKPRDVKVPHALGEGEFLQFKLRYGNVKKYLDDSWISHRLGQVIPDKEGEPIYIFTVSSNGVMRFHPWGGESVSGYTRKLLHGYGDSEGMRQVTLLQNLHHAGKFGCFCFGIIYKEKEDYTDSAGKIVPGGRTFVMRYNRWATDNKPIYAMVRQREDQIDTSVPVYKSAGEDQSRCCCVTGDFGEGNRDFCFNLPYSHLSWRGTCPKLCLKPGEDGPQVRTCNWKFLLPVLMRGRQRIQSHHRVGACSPRKQEEPEPVQAEA